MPNKRFGFIRRKETFTKQADYPLGIKDFFAIMNGPKTIYFLSAADRLNYGDLLFPLIFKSFCDQKKIGFRNYGLVKSDYSEFGGLPTMSYLQLLKDLKKGNGILVVGGGEVFFGNWVKLY